MKFGAECCLYDDCEYLDAVMYPISRHLDQILFLINDKPWSGKPADNSAVIDKVTRMCQDNPSMRLIRGQWGSEIEQRNSGLDTLYREGFDIAFIIDNDEIHEDWAFQRMKNFIENRPEYDAYHMEWDTYWTKKYYRIHPRESFKPVVAVKPAHFKFTKIRQGTTSIMRTEHGILWSPGSYNGILIPPHFTACHHMSYARDDAYTKRKLETSSHTSEFIPDWYDRVWLKWKPGDHNLHPITPSQYKTAVPTMFRDWPPQLQFFAKKERMSKRACTVVILNWDSKDMLKRCLKCIRDNTPDVCSLIIVDNGSTKDDSVLYLKWLERLYPRISVIYNKENRGFATGVNQAMRQAKDTDIVLMNVDAEPQKGWLESLYATMVENPNAGIVGPLGNEVASEHQKEGSVKEDTMVSNLHGFCMLILREVIEEIGYFDESYSIGGYEDNDYGMRAKMAGYSLWISAKSLVRHRAHQVFLSHGLNPYENEARNREIYVNKFHNILYQVAQRENLYQDRNWAKTMKLIIKE